MHMAIFGGTFNPIHFGHLRIAEEVLEDLGLDKAVFMPASVPPHKPEAPVTPPQARLEMLRLAIADNPNFEASDAEIKRGGRSFTIDTVRELREKGPKDIRISLIVGDDSFNNITTWCEYEALIESANFIVVPRPGYAMKKPAEALPVELARKFWYDSDTDSYMNSYGTAITYIQTTLMDISSSDIRRRVKEGLSVRYLMPEEVIGYIMKEGLYR